MIKIFIANLSAYNDGKMIGEWITLPQHPDELEEAINKILEAGGEEVFIADYESDFGIEINEYEDPQIVNSWAETLEQSEEKYNEDIINAVISEFRDPGTALGVLESGDFTVYQGIYDYEELGHALVESWCLFEGSDDSLLARYFDYETFGRDACFDGITIYSDLGIAIDYHS